MTAKLYVWHRRLALFVMLPLLLFGLSGLLHPVMRLTAPELDQRFFATSAWPDNLPVLSDISDELSLQKTQGFRPVKIGSEWYLQHWESREQESRFFGLTGQPEAAATHAYATELARHFSGDHNSKVKEIRFITEFGHGYAPINRLLPVWEVKFDRSDNLSVFVDLRHERLATVVDDKRRLFMQAFHLMHVWAFIDQENSLRTVVFIGLMAASLFLGLSGIYLFLVLPLRKRKNSDVKKVHAWSGLLVSLALLMFVFSGLVRTLEKQLPEIRGVALNQTLDLSQINVGFNAIQQRFPEVKNAYPHLIDERVVWQLIIPRKPEVWIDAQSAEVLNDGAVKFSYGMMALLNMEQGQGDSTRLISSFKADEHYGFIDKRLPVMALDYPGNSYYVDTRDAVVSVSVSEADKAFSWIFRYLHKWRFADGLGLNGRDGLISFFVLATCLTIIFGFKSWLKGRRKRKTSAQVDSDSIKSAATP